MRGSIVRTITGGLGRKSTYVIKPLKVKNMILDDNTLELLNTVDNDNMENVQFVLGSVTKVFTAAAILILHEQGNLNIHDKIGKYIDKKELKNIKIIDLINHTSGMKRNPDNSSVKIKKKHKNATDAYNSFIDENLITGEPVHSYSNLGYIVLGKIIEDVTGKDYYEVLNSLIMKPLNMTNTTVENNSNIYTNKNMLTSEQENEKYFATTAGSLSSTLSDMIKFKDVYKLFELKLLKQLWFYSEKEGTHMIKHGGSIYGGKIGMIIEWGEKNNFHLDVIMY